jgi:hypothetical protein
MGWVSRHRTVIAISVVCSVIGTYVVRLLDWSLPRFVDVLLNAAPEWTFGFVIGFLTATSWIFVLATIGSLLLRASHALIARASTRLPTGAQAEQLDLWRVQLARREIRPLGAFRFAIGVWLVARLSESSTTT